MFLSGLWFNRKVTGGGYVVPTAWLVWEYLLDGNANDTSVEAVNGTANNITRSSVWSVEVATFSGTSPSVAIPYDASRDFNPSSDDYSFSFYVKNDDLTRDTWYHINDSNSNFSDWYNMYAAHGVWYTFNIYTGSTSYLAPWYSITESQWTHICVVVEWWVEYKVYIDNVLQWTISLSWISSFTSGDWYRLGNNITNVRSLDGQMALFRIYNTLLTADDRENLRLEWVDLLWL